MVESDELVHANAALLARPRSHLRLTKLLIEAYSSNGRRQDG